MLLYIGGKAFLPMIGAGILLKEAGFIMALTSYSLEKILGVSSLKSVVCERLWMPRWSNESFRRSFGVWCDIRCDSGLKLCYTGFL